MAATNELPAAIITRIFKQATNDKANIASDAKAALRYAARIFVLYVSSCAKDIAISSNRSTMQAKDVLKALNECDFPEIAEMIQKEQKFYLADLARKKARKAGPEAGEGKDGKEGFDIDENDDGEMDWDAEDAKERQEEKAGREEEGEEGGTRKAAEQEGEAMELDE